MEIILLCGIQASGKSTYYRQNFIETHTLVSMDVLGDRNKETKLMNDLISKDIPFIVDNTNLTISERARYIQLAKINKINILCYYLQTQLIDALMRNCTREGKTRVPDQIINTSFKKFQKPSFKEGFQKVFMVIPENGGFKTIKEKH